MSNKIGPRLAVYPIPPENVARTHSWPTYNLDTIDKTSPCKLSAAEKTGLTYGAFDGGERFGNAWNPWSWKDQFILPQDVHTGKVKLKWGNRPDLSDFHGALDIGPFNKKDETVRCALTGKVVKVRGEDTGYCSVWVLSKWRDATILWVYQHLHNVGLPRRGATIATGEVIAQVGKLGRMSHLHLEAHSKANFGLDYSLYVPANALTGLRSQFGYGELEAVGYKIPYYMYNAVALINRINE